MKERARQRKKERVIPARDVQTIAIHRFLWNVAKGKTVRKGEKKIIQRARPQQGKAGGEDIIVLMKSVRPARGKQR